MESERHPPEEPHPDEPRGDEEPIPMPERGDPLPSDETAETPDEDLVDRTQDLMRDGLSERSPKR